MRPPGGGMRLPHRSGSGPTGWEEPAAREIREHLRRAWDRLGVGPPDEGSGAGFLAGQLLRPRFAASAAGPHELHALGERFWLATLAVQLAHEASLLHDDVVDGAPVRRGHPTLFERGGVAAALIAGDQLLARAYLAAVATDCPDYVLRFARAVDVTITGERTQGEARGRSLDPARARTIARMKSGELFGCALASAATLGGDGEAEARAELGRDVGALYQEVDDLLDFCPHAGTGKTPLADHSRGLWTWPRRFLVEGDPPEALFRRETKGIPALRALDHLERSAEALLARLDLALPHAAGIRTGVRAWLSAARSAVTREVEAASDGGSGWGRVPRALPGPGADPARLLSRHGRSFHFASRLMPAEDRSAVTRVYGFCRLVDDAVDLAPDRDAGRRALDALAREALDAYRGRGGGGPPVMEAMRDMRDRGLPFELVEKLFEGMEMDLDLRRFPDQAGLRAYTHRVAGVVGLWIAGLAGIRDPWALCLADELGHSMQLTNIARDVGADLAMGRLYLPADLLDRHLLSEEALRRIAVGTAPVPATYAALLEELMGWADAGYGAAFQALPHLPPGYRRAMAVASRVYQGIHREIRRNGYDTLRRRARTGTVRKSVLAAGALRRLLAAEGRHESRPPGSGGHRAPDPAPPRSRSRRGDGATPGARGYT
jgi:15-cis-phytoene synthase